MPTHSDVRKVCYCAEGKRVTSGSRVWVNNAGRDNNAKCKTIAACCARPAAAGIPQVL